MIEKRESPYGRSRKKSFFPAEQYDGETYYNKPALKPSHYGWTIAIYFFIGGLAGAAQIFATILDLFAGKEGRGTVRRGRTIALLGAIASPILLIADLHKPERWYNMIRIFRKTSPMSIGVYILSVFGIFSGLTAVFDWFNSRLAKLFQIPAAIAGAGMAIYTGVLLSATSTPLWAALPRKLPALFGLSAAATAVSALSFNQPERTIRGRLERLSLLLGVAELLLSKRAEETLAQKGTDSVLHEQPWREVNEIGVKQVGIVLPLILRMLPLLSNGRFRFLSDLASLGTLTGGLLFRALYVLAGNESAKRPKDYFQLTQPGMNDE